uniref:Putative secreted protein n=1 Tax=Ixodes scapularis TaxID=6945 RepID=A0A4D5RX37_IXOSC
MLIGSVWSSISLVCAGSRSTLAPHNFRLSPPSPLVAFVSSLDVRASSVSRHFWILVCSAGKWAVFHKGAGCGEQVQTTQQYSLLSTYQSPIQAFSKLEDEKKKKNYIVFPLWVRAVFGHSR